MPTIPAILRALDPAARAALVCALPDAQLRALARSFPEWAHPGQLPPPSDWRTWVLMAGRGFGKTRAGAEWVLGLVRDAGARGSSPVRGGGPAQLVEGHHRDHRKSRDNQTGSQAP